MDIAIAFLIGLLLIGITVFIFRLGKEGLFGFLLNALIGTLIVGALTLFGIFPIPLNPLTALIVGYGGVIGLGLIIIILLFF